jgi:hypothetical protein
MKNFISIIPQRLAFPMLAASGLALGATSYAASYSETVLADQPTAYYRLEDAADSASIVDSSTSGAFGGTVTFDELASYPKFVQPGIGSNSVSFHLYTPEGGALQRSHIEVPFASELNQAGPFSVECWVRPTSVGTDYRCPVGNFGGWGSDACPRLALLPNTRGWGNRHVDLGAERRQYLDGKQTGNQK